MINQDYSDLSQAVITEDNVQRIAELIALKALKTLCKFPQKAFTHLYNGLIRDVYYSYNPEHTFSDAYDLVQSLICFLWEKAAFLQRTIAFSEALCYNLKNIFTFYLLHFTYYFDRRESLCALLQDITAAKEQHPF